MQSTQKLVTELENAIQTVIDECDLDNEAIVQLIRKCGEVVGTLKCLGDFDLKHIMYDMARLSAGAGWTPDDFDKKAQE